jgi:glycerophosphoryl diester phosphodiesterase
VTGGAVHLQRGNGADGFRDAFAEYALYYRLGVDAVVTDLPDLAVIARRG